MTLMMANLGTSTYTQGFAGWMQQQTTFEEELTNALGQVVQTLLFVNSYRTESLQFGRKTNQDVKCGIIEFSFYNAQSVVWQLSTCKSTALTYRQPNDVADNNPKFMCAHFGWVGL